MKKVSTWAALKNPDFRRLWIGTVISGTCVAAHDTAGRKVLNDKEHEDGALTKVSALANRRELSEAI
jgi:hypothetical protein